MPNRILEICDARHQMPAYLQGLLHSGRVQVGNMLAHAILSFCDAVSCVFFKQEASQLTETNTNRQSNGTYLRLYECLVYLAASCGRTIAKIMP